jgi:putative Holliday junction resolvase
MTVPLPQQGRLVGIDYGTVRIGVAVTDPRRTLASPYENYNRRGLEADARYFRALAEQEQIVGFVVGLPVHVSGDESQKSHESRQFGQWLAETTSLPVQYYDERYTSSQAEQLLGGAQLTKKQRKKRRDMLAAQIILSSYLESNTRQPHDPGSLDD